jgi:phosphoglycolate phosphatase
MGMARSAGATAVGAAWGYHPADELLAAGAHAVAEAPLDVLTLLSRLMELSDG